MTTRLQAERHRQVTDAVHEEGGAIALQVLHAGRYGYHPFSASARRDEVADHAVQAERAVDAGASTGRSTDFARSRRAGEEGRLRRRRDHGLRGLPDQPVPRRAHQRPHRRVGRQRREADAVPGRGRAPVARARRRGLPDHLPHLAARPGRGRPDLGRGRRARPAARGGRRHGLQHRHRLARGAGPDDHHPGPARGLDARATARLRAEVVESRCAPPTGSTPPSSPRQLLADGERRPGVDGAAVPRRPRLRRQGRGRPRRRDQHLHRLQPGLPRPHLRQPDGVLPGEPARLPRDRAGAAARTRARRPSPSSAPGRPVSPRPSPRPSAASP